MFSPDDLSTVYGFLKSTGEGNLKKMLVGGTMTEAHFKILMKVVRGTTEADFISNFMAGTFPRVKLAAAELALREDFWIPCTDALLKVGLISHQKQAA